MVTPLDRLRSALRDRFRVDRLLGHGGMADVYLAQDLRHDRPVVLKVVRPELAVVLGSERFLREIGITARLDHPHIVPLLESGDAEGILYYVMPFIDGGTLRQRLEREKQLPIDEVVRITREIASALGYAHSKGLLHRDIKPENILIGGGHVRVVDFGIAKAVAAASGESLTESGIVMGTPAYMSPEQVAGNSELDGRSDLYGLACLVHEMLAGQPPFVGPTIENISRQHLTAAPPPIAQFRPAVPAKLAEAVARALAKVPADRFATVQEFADALAEPMSVPSDQPVTQKRSVPWLVVAGVVLAAGLGWVLLAKPRLTTSAEARPSLVVLPFRNLGPPADEYFADGLTEEISARLTRISGLAIISRSSALQYKGATRSVQDIAKELGVRYVLVGTVRTDRAADGSGQVRVAPQLIRVGGSTDLPMEAYTSGLTPGEVFAAQSQIAEQVAGALDVTLLARERQGLQRQETVDGRAYDAYLLGRFHFNRTTAAGIEEASRYFESAVAADSGYARAYAGLAVTYAQIAFYPEIALPIATAYDRAEVAARRAIGLDSTLAEAHASLGFILANGKRRWDEAEREFRRAIELDPDYAPARAWLADLLMLRRRNDEASTQIEKAVALEPTAPAFRHLRAQVNAFRGRFDEAVADERAALSLQPSYIMPRVWIAQIAFLRGDLRAMAAEMEQIPSASAAMGPAIRRYADDPSRKAELIAAIAGLRSPNGGLNAARQSWMYASFGAVDSALVSLERAAASPSTPGLGVLRFPSVTRMLGAEPRYQALLKNLGLEP